MGAFTAEMEALVNGIRASAKGRATAIAGVKKNTARILSDARGLIGTVGKSRRDMSRRLHRQLHGASGALRKSVEALLRNFDLAQKRANVLGFLATDRKGRSTFVEGLMGDIERARADRSDQLAKTLREFTDRIHGEVTQLLTAAQASRQASCGAAQKTVFEALSAIRARVAGIAQEARDFVQASEEARGRMGNEVREGLSLGREARQEKLGALLQAFDETQRRVAADVRAATELWRGLGLPPAAPAERKPTARALRPKAAAGKSRKASSKSRPTRKSR